MLPTLALVGRPNVGKSTLFNRLLRRNRAITHDRPGVTRDRIYGEAEEEGVRFALVDTGGMVLESEESGEGFEKAIFEQVREAVGECHGILFVVDGREGLTTLDRQAAEFVRQSNRPVVLVVNKVDGSELEAQATADFHALGFELLPVSGSHGYGLAELRERVAAMAKAVDPGPDMEPVLQTGLRLSMLGRPNAGKSSLVNAITGQDRLMVSAVAGTTRDSIDVTFESGRKRYTFVDSAGVRRRSNIDDSLERFSVMRALKSSKKADVTLLVVDAMEGFTRQDKRLVAFLDAEKTPFIVVVNKADLIPGKDMAQLRKYFEHEMRLTPHTPTIYTSTVTRAGLGGILPLAEKLWKECGLRVGTGQLNRAIRTAIERHQPPMVQRRRAKFYYMTQADEPVPTFVCFVNNPDLIKTAYARYLETSLRKLFNIRMAPVSVVFRSSHERKED